jgi:hypothetical protein
LRAFQGKCGRVGQSGTRLTVVVDGAELHNVSVFRQASTTCFNLSARVPGAPRVAAATDGYWIAIRPLAPGHHSIKFGAILSDLAQGVIYELDVADDPKK